MASAVTRTQLRLDSSRNASLFANTETAVGGSETTVLDKFNCQVFNRYSVQIFNSDGSVAGTAKVYGSLKDSPSTEGGSDWTQIGDDISVGTNSSALKAISTTPVRWLCIRATGNGAELTCNVYGEQV